MPCSPMISVEWETTVFPETKSKMEDLKLSVSDLPMLSCHYIQKGCLFAASGDQAITNESVVGALSRALARFPPLAGRLVTDSAGRVFLSCNDAGALFLEASAPGILLRHLLEPLRTPSHLLRPLFPFDSALSFSGHSRPLLAVQLTRLADGLFLACALNHAVADGTSYWNFFNTFAASCRGGPRHHHSLPDFTRSSLLVSETAVLRFPDGGPALTFANEKPIAERIFRFSRAAVAALKALANECNDAEAAGKRVHDTVLLSKGSEISSFQSLCALLWSAVTRARALGPTAKTTLRLAVNCRPRVRPEMEPFYFGNAIQSVPTECSAGEVTGRGLRWCAKRLNTSVRAHGDAAVRRAVADWEASPRSFPLGNPDGASITIGSSPRFPMYDNDFGWGPPIAVRSGPANKFDGKISAFPGKEGPGTVDLEVVLSVPTMAALESDSEFMHYVSH